MATEKHYRTWIRPHPRYSESAQKDGAKGQVYVAGKHVTLASFIKSTRPGDVVWVQWLFLLAEPRSRKNKKPLVGLRATIKTIEARGATIEEWGSGNVRMLAKSADRDDMTYEAVEMIRASGRAAGLRKTGRPKRVIPKDQLDTMERAWFSYRNPTNEAAVNDCRAHGIKRVSIPMLWRLFGPSGRVAKRPRA